MLKSKIKEDEINKIIDNLKFHLKNHKGFGEIKLKLAEGKLIYIENIELSKIK